jgi:ATP-binding cassette subfamily B protein
MRFDYGYSEEQKLGKAYDWKLFKKLIPYVLPYRFLLLVSVLLVILITLLELGVPYLTKMAIDRHIVPTREKVRYGTGEPVRMLTLDSADPAVQDIIHRRPDLFEIKEDIAVIPFERLGALTRQELVRIRQRDLSGLMVVVVAFLGVVLTSFGLNFLQKLIMEYAGHTIMHDLRLRLFAHIQELPVSFFNRNPVARLVTRVTNDVANMHELFTSVIALIFKDIFMLVGIAAVLLIMNVRLALIGFGMLPFVLLLAFVFSSRIRDVFRGQRIKVAEINTRFAETISGIKVIQAFGQEKDNQTAFEGLNHANYILGMRQIRIFALFMPLIQVFSVATLAILIFYGGSNVLGETISIGTLVAFISYMRMFFRPIRDLAEKYNIIQNAMASAERIFLLFDKPAAIDPPAQSGRTAREDPLKRIAVDNVSFSYDENEPVLEGIHFNLKAGQTVAIVGPTGSGKTTLVNLLIRFYEPQQGRILLNGLDIAAMPSSFVRSRMALVAQEPFLFSGTLRENIFQTGVDPTQQEIERILKASRLDGLIERLPDGLDTRLIEGGASLSSGERQLIAIARAFARDPELIILDEATSHIDSQTEKDLQEAMLNLMKDRTALMVAHRLSTARFAQRILVFNRGRMVESGSHRELIQNRGFYYRLSRIQNNT